MLSLIGQVGSELVCEIMAWQLEAEMLPQREEFILDVRRNARLEQKPTVVADSELIKPDGLSKVLHRAAFWLTPKVVEKYNTSDFSSSPEENQFELRRSVDEFRGVAGRVASDKPATKEQFEQGLESFQRLVAAVQKIVLPEWKRSAEELVAQTETWSADLGWKTRRVEKHLTETLLGSYSLPQLQLYAEHLFVLDPVARFVPAAMGAFELSIQPSFEVKTVYRDFAGTWLVRLGSGPKTNGTLGEPWNKDSFGKAIEELRRLL